MEQIVDVRTTKQRIAHQHREIESLKLQVLTLQHQMQELYRQAINATVGVA